MQIKILLTILFSISTLSSVRQAPILLYAGTQLYLTLNQRVSSAEVEEGHLIELLVENDVVVNGKIVIATGSMAEGKVTKVVKSCGNRCHVRCAQLTIVAESVQAVDGQRITLRGIPFTVKGDCYSDVPAIADLRSKLSARILNNVRIEA